MATAETSGEIKLALRVKSKKSQNAVLRDVSTKDTVKSLLEKLAILSGVPEGQIALLKGFPPKRISYESSNLVKSLGLQHQDTIIVELDTTGSPNRGDEPSAGPSGNPAPTAGVNQTVKIGEQSNLPVASAPESAPVENNGGMEYSDLIPSTEEDSGLLLRHIVPSDNSCLFTSVTFCLSGQQLTETDKDSSFLRELIANQVAADPDRFNAGVLERPNADYVAWIKKPESWGGSVELSILAEFYGIQISVVDTQSLHIASFGEDKNYPQCIFLIYDGIHYDPLYYESFTGGTRTVFDSNNTKMMELAMQLAREANASNQFTDLKNFALRCQVCNKLLKGESEAQEHAKKTSHTAFAEIKKD